MDDTKNVKYGYILAILAGSCWGLMGILTRGLSDVGFNSLQIAALRPTVAIVVYGLYHLIRNPKIFKVDLKGLLFFMIYGVVAFDGMFLSFTYSIQYTSIATASVLLFTNPIIVMILSRIIFKEQLTKRKVISMILTLIGCCLIVKAYDPNSLKLNALGIIFGIISGFAVAIQNILGKIGTQKYDSRTQLVYSFIFAAVFFWMFSSPVKLVTVATTPKAWILIAAIGFFATVVPNGAFIKALQYLEPSKVSILTSVEPIVAAILAYLIFGEKLELLQVIGMVVIIFGVSLLQERKKKHTLQEIEV